MSLSDSTAARLLAFACAAAAAAALAPAAPAQARGRAKAPPASTCETENPRKVSLKAVKAEPRLGEKISGYPKSGGMLMTSSGGIQTSYEVRHKGIHYVVATKTNDEKVISYVGSHDPAFRTPEGLAVGDTLRRVLSLSGSGVTREPGWAFNVRLPSGWTAAFVQGESLTEGELPPEARVCFFYMRR